MKKINSDQMNTDIEQTDVPVDPASDVGFEEQYETDFDFDFWQDVFNELW